MTNAEKKPEAGKGKKKKRKHKGRELVECLLVAGALALTIRTFGFQIFKIPTRSMEPALYGNEDYGDRVVAMMWYKRGRLGLRMGQIKRWQVIVFDHQDRQMPKSSNYIKRVVGLPGETVQLHDGDVWIDGSIARKPRALQEDLWIKLGDLDFSRPWRLPYYWQVEQRGGPARPEERFRDGRLILTSTAENPVLMHWCPGRGIDNRFIRTTVLNTRCPNPECRRGDREFRAVFDTARPVAFCPACHAPVWGVTDGGRAGLLEVATTTAAGESIGDFWTEQEMGIGKGSAVGDLRLSMDFLDQGRPGRLEVVLTSRSERFAFRLPLGETDPLAELAGPRQLAESQRVPLSAGTVRHLEVVNVDGEFRAELDGVEIGPLEYLPPIAENRYVSDAEISVSGGGGVELSGLRLYRDIYYGHTTSGAMDACGPGDKSSFIVVPEKHYFFMGDNSLASKDGRIFGTKPEKKIVARGVFVIWPPSRMHWIK